MNHFRQAGNSRQRQRGAVAIIVGLSLFVLIGIIGLVLDLGHMFVAKTELQNASDACALAAARELDGGSDALTRAVAAGIATGTRNGVDFQGHPVTILSDDVKFSPNLSPNSAYVPVSGGANPATSQYAMCTVTQTGIAPYVMQVLGFGPQTVSATAVASLQPSQINCAIPLGMCTPPTPPATCKTPGSTPDALGFCVGDWYDGKFPAGTEDMTGSFNWIDFTPPGGGASEMAGLLSGQGLCNLNVSTPVGEPGEVQGVAKAWNSRFGIYTGGVQPTEAPPDFTGYAYTTQATSWPQGYNALPDFLAKRQSHTTYQDDSLVFPDHKKAIGTPLTTQAHLLYGQDRRLVTVPVVNCAGWGSSQTVPIVQWACVLMLAPMSNDTSGQTLYLEYQGLSNTPGSPCATSGLPGSASGPKVPTLVQ